MAKVTRKGIGSVRTRRERKSVARRGRGLTSRARNTVRRGARVTSRGL